MRVLTRSDGFLGIDNPRLRHIRLHEHVNDLPDPNYATLKYFLGHLQRFVDGHFSCRRCGDSWRPHVQDIAVLGAKLHDDHEPFDCVRSDAVQPGYIEWSTEWDHFGPDDAE